MIGYWVSKHPQNMLIYFPNYSYQGSQHQIGQQHQGFQNYHQEMNPKLQISLDKIERDLEEIKWNQNLTYHQCHAQCQNITYPQPMDIIPQTPQYPQQQHFQYLQYQEIFQHQGVPQVKYQNIPQK